MKLYLDCFVPRNDGHNYILKLKMDSTNNSSSSQPEKNKNDISFEIPAHGSLGILALGAVGIKAWRKKRDEELAKLKDIKKDE